MRNAAQTRKDILSAATAEFARRGLDGARIDQIAKRAKINKNMIYLYYGRKDDLFLAVLENAYLTLRAAQDVGALRDLDPKTGLEAFVRSTYRAFLDKPDIIPLANSENIHRARHLKASTRVQELFAQIPGSIGALIERGHAAGLFRAGIDPVELYVSIVSMCSYHISNQYSLSVVLKSELMTSERQHRREEHVVEMVLRFVLRDPPA